MTADYESPVQELQNAFRSILQAVGNRTEGGTHALDITLPEERFGDFKAVLASTKAVNKSGAITAALTGILFEFISTDTSSDETIAAVANLLDFALILSEQDGIDQILFFNLSEIFLDSQTIDAAREFFRYFEAKVSRLNKGMDGTRGKGPVLLRLCNELLGRLSKTEDTIFCGRIRVLLSDCFPLGEKSGVNHAGKFHTANVTSFEVKPREQDADAMEGVEEKADKSSVSGQRPQMSLDELYPVFWSLQSDFADPTRLFEPEGFKGFRNGLEATLSKFKAVNNEGKEDDEDTSRRSEKRRRETGSGDHFNPKYLTSRELFDLEVYDLTFRRHILVQAYILIDFLLSLTPAAKELWDNEIYTNNALKTAFKFTLPAEAEKWAIHTKQVISEYLQPNHEGRLFFRSVETILSRDKNWVRWKMQNCPPFQKDPLLPEAFGQTTERVKRLCKPSSPFAHAMGTQALSRLWKDGASNSGLDSLRNSKRFRLPEPSSYIKGIENDFVDIESPLTAEDGENAATAKASKTWRALRVAARDRYHLFNHIEEQLAKKRKADNFRAEDDVPERRNDLAALLEAEKEEKLARERGEDSVVKEQGRSDGEAAASSDAPKQELSDTNGEENVVMSG